MSGICTVEFGIETPPEWGVRMVEIGAKFFYQDEAGHPAGEYYTSKLSNILTHGRDFISSNDAGKCTYQILAIAKLSVPGQQDQNFTASDNADKDHCLLKCPFVIAPRASVSPRVANLRDLEFESNLDFISVGLLSRIMKSFTAEIVSQNS